MTSFSIQTWDWPYYKSPYSDLRWPYYKSPYRSIDLKTDLMTGSTIKTSDWSHYKSHYTDLSLTSWQVSIYRPEPDLMKGLTIQTWDDLIKSPYRYRPQTDTITGPTMQTWTWPHDKSYYTDMSLNSLQVPQYRPEADLITSIPIRPETELMTSLPITPKTGLVTSLPIRPKADLMTRLPIQTWCWPHDKSPYTDLRLTSWQVSLCRPETDLMTSLTIVFVFGLVLLKLTSCVRSIGCFFTLLDTLVDNSENHLNMS